METGTYGSSDGDPRSWPWAFASYGLARLKSDTVYSDER